MMYSIIDNVCQYSEERKFTVYMHIVPKEINDYGYDKYYIGITGTSVEQRWGSNGCRYKLGNGRHEGLFYRAIQKYGWDNIKHIILFENLTEKEAWDKEIDLIKKYKSNDPKYGYNHTSGGGGTNGMKHSKETRQLLSKMQKGKKKNKDNILHIVQFTTEGRFVKFYDRMSDIKEVDNNVNAKDIKTTIWRNIHGETLTAYGYVWRYENDVLQTSDGEYVLTEKDFELLQTIKNRSKIYKFSMSGNFIDEFQNASETAKKEGVLYTSIFTNACKTKTPRQGYIWLYEDDVEFIDGIWVIKDFYNQNFETRYYKAIFQFNDKGEFIREYSSLYDASQATKISRPTISKNLMLEKPHLKNGYIWRGLKGVIKENGTYRIKTN